jgi:succinoglycan biosynthesis protein ExoM
MKPTVSVMIASMGRESLRETLISVGRAEIPPGESVEVIVADDSSDGAVAELLGDRHPGVIVLDVRAGNVSIARNACLDAARGDWLIFVDDDEYVDEGWITGHLNVAREFHADAVFGPVYHIYPDAAPDWFKAADPLFQDWRWQETGRQLKSGRTGNTLIRSSTLDRIGLRFDEDFGRSGGEDDEFFRRMAAAGAKLIVTDRAKAWEIVPEDRANAGYILKRFTRSGQTHAIVALRGASALKRGLFAAGAVIKLAVAMVGYALAAPFNRTSAFRMQMRIASNRGKLLAVAGSPLGSSWT